MLVPEVYSISKPHLPLKPIAQPFLSQISLAINSALRQPFPCHGQDSFADVPAGCGDGPDLKLAQLDPMVLPIREGLSGQRQCCVTGSLGENLCW